MRSLRKQCQPGIWLTKKWPGERDPVDDVIRGKPLGIIRSRAVGPTRVAQEMASWLSLATRSKASLELLIRYWQSSPSVGSWRITS